MAEFDLSGEGDPEKMAAIIGPQQIDNFIRQAIQFCWMSLPTKRRTPKEVEKQIRRIVDRALKDLHDDSDAFRKNG